MCSSQGLGLGQAEQGHAWGYLLLIAGLLAALPLLVCLARVAARHVHRPVYLSVVCAGTAVMGLCFVIGYRGWLRELGICLNIAGLGLAVWAARQRDACSRPDAGGTESTLTHL